MDIMRILLFCFLFFPVKMRARHVSTIMWIIVGDYFVKKKHFPKISELIP